MIVRELIHIIGFRINEAQYATVEQRVRQLGSMMSFITTVPIVMLGKSFVEAANNVQQFNLALETYADNAGQAEQVSKELQDLALSMPSAQIEDLSASTSNLLARGIPMADLVDTFRTFYVITGATGGNMKGLTKAYTDSLGKGKLAGQEFNQFINASVPLRKALVGFTGKSIDTLIKMQKEGKITFEVLKGALKDLAKEGGQFSNIMEKKSYTLWGMWMKLKDMWFLLKKELGDKEMIPLRWIVEWLQKITTALRGLDGNWKRFIIILMGVAAVAGPLMVIWSLLKSFMGPIGYITAAIGIISLIIDDIYVWIAGGKSVLGLMFGDYEKYKGQITELKAQLINMFSELWGVVKNVLTDVLKLFGIFSGKDQDYTGLNVLLDLLNKIAYVVSFILRGINGWLQVIGYLTSARNAAADATGKAIKNALPDAMQPDKNHYTAGQYAYSFMTIPNQIWDAFGSLQGKGIDTELFKLSQWLGSKVGGPKAAGETFVSPFKKEFGEMGPVFSPNMYLTVNAPSGDAATLVPAIQKVVDDSLSRAAREINSRVK